MSHRMYGGWKQSQALIVRTCRIYLRFNVCLGSFYKGDECQDSPCFNDSPRAHEKATCTGLLCRLQYMQTLKADDMGSHPPDTLSGCNSCMRAHSHCIMEASVVLPIRSF